LKKENVNSVKYDNELHGRRCKHLCVRISIH